MKVAVINLSGNTGKTTLSKHLLAPQLHARRIQIEDVNVGDGEPDLELAASKFKTLAAELNSADDTENFVIDIGASNAVAMVDHFAQLKTTRAGIDYWLIPVVPASKQKADSINTASTLIKIGVKPDRIVMVLNNIVDTLSVEYDFAQILAMRNLGIHVASQAVLTNEIYELLKGTAESVFDLSNNRPDFKALLKTARDKKDTNQVRELGIKMVHQDLAEDAAANLKAVYESMPLQQHLTQATVLATAAPAKKLAAA